MPEFEALTLDGAVDLLLSAEKPVIISHKRPDGDTLGSAAALCLFFASLGRPAAFLCDDKIPDRLAFLFEGVPTVKEPAEGGFYLAVDIASPTQMGGLADKYLPRMNMMIDHHERGIPFAPHFTEPSAAAAGETVYKLLARAAERGLCPRFDGEVAARLYAAISSDTGGFRFQNTTPLTHRIAADLLEYSIRADRINHALFTAKSPEVLEAERISLANLHRTADGRIAYVLLTKAARGTLADEYFETAIDIARAVQGAEVAISVREIGEGVFRASLRSVDADVASVAVLFEGGGHLHAAGCTVKAACIEEAVSLLIAEVQKRI